MSHYRRIAAGVVLLIGLLYGMRIPVSAAPERSLQRLAMHATTQNDITRYDDAPRYTMVGSVDVMTRTLQMRQTLEWINTTGSTVAELPFHLYANLSDFAGQTRIQRAYVAGIAIPFHYNVSHSVVTVQLPAALRAGATVVVTLEYQTTIPIPSPGRMPCINTVCWWTVAPARPALTTRTVPSWSVAFSSRSSAALEVCSLVGA